MSLMLMRIFFCIFAASFAMYAYIDKHNELTELRIAIPALTKEVHNIQEENKRLRYEIDRFESPIHLMELAKKPEFSHLKYPHQDEVITLSLKNPREKTLPHE